MRTIFFCVLYYSTIFSQSLDFGIGGTYYKNDLTLLNFGLRQNYENANVGFRFGIGSQEKELTQVGSINRTQKTFVTNYEFLIGYKGGLMLCLGLGLMQREIEVTSSSLSNVYETKMLLSAGILIRPIKSLPFNIGMHYISDMENSFGLSAMIWM